MSDEQEMTETQRMRAEMNRLKKENKEMRADLRPRELRFAIEDAGFDPNTVEGKALSKTYDHKTKVSVEGVRQLATEEYGFDLPAPGGSPEAVEAWLNAERQHRNEQRQQGEDRLSMLGRGAIPAREPSTNDRINKALADGDLREVDRLNLQLMYEQAR